MQNMIFTSILSYLCLGRLCVQHVCVRAQHWPANMTLVSIPLFNRCILVAGFWITYVLYGDIVSWKQQYNERECFYSIYLCLKTPALGDLFLDDGVCFPTDMR